MQSFWSSFYSWFFVSVLYPIFFVLIFHQFCWWIFFISENLGNTFRYMAKSPGFCIVSLFAKWNGILHMIPYFPQKRLIASHIVEHRLNAFLTRSPFKQQFAQAEHSIGKVHYFGWFLFNFMIFFYITFALFSHANFARSHFYLVAAMQWLVAACADCSTVSHRHDPLVWYICKWITVIRFIFITYE